MNINEPNESPDLFDLEECHDRELAPLIRELCDKAQDLGVPIFVTACYKSDKKGAWLASSARVRKDFIPKEFYIIRAVVEGRTEVVDLGELASKITRQ